MLSATLAFTIASCTNNDVVDHNDELWYDHPADIWEEYLPLGNGRLGLMPQGGIASDHIVLNEISMWSGSEFDYSNPKAAESLPRIRKLLFEGKNYEAQQLMYDTFVPRSTSGGAYGAYQMLGDLNITFGIDTIVEPTNYRRSLNMQKGIATTEFTIGDNTIRREYFASRHDDLIAIHMQSTRPTNITTTLSRPERSTTHANGNTIVMSGELDSGQDDVTGVRYVAIMGALDDAQCSASSTTDSTITFSNATDVTLVISAQTSYMCGDQYQVKAATIMANTLGTDYEDMREAHIADHQELYDRVKIKLKGNGDEALPTDQRIFRYAESSDPALAELYYNYGRYSLISSTRSGSLPPNLQGLWANECGTPWNGDYHVNINMQMNHWPLEQGNLDELYEPFVSLVERSVESGKQTAKAFYGKDAQGWVMHMMTNVWNFTAPGEHPSWGATNTGGAWLCEHLWERYEYTCDTAYLRRIYPVLRGAAEFFHSTMVEEPNNGWLVTAPTSSPENSFYIKGCQEPISVCMAPTMDIEIIKELYTNVISSAEILNIEDDLVAQLKDDIKRLPPLQISPNGYLQEWLEDYAEVDVHHRHVSHLYALHPSNQISPIETPELAEACRQTLNRRGDEGTGWSRAWKINFWARLFDGNRAEKLIKSLFSPAVKTDGSHTSGTFPNLWCSHPPFQLDGNFGGAAGIGEMLLQSHMSYINPLPALPDSWTEGSVDGMRVRGGATVSMNWEKNKLKEMTLCGGNKKTYKIALPTNISRVVAHYADGQYAELTSEGYNGTQFVTADINNGSIRLSFE